MIDIKNKIVLKAIIIGLLADIIGSLLTGAIFGVCYGAYLAIHGVPENEIVIALQSGSPILIFGLVFGFGFSLLGGYIAGNIASKNHILHGGIIGGLCVIIGISMLPISHTPIWYNVISTIFVIPFCLAGSVIAKNKQAKHVA